MLMALSLSTAQTKNYCTETRTMYQDIENPKSHLLPGYMNKSQAPVNWPEL